MGGRVCECRWVCGVCACVRVGVCVWECVWVLSVWVRVFVRVRVLARACVCLIAEPAMASAAIDIVWPAGRGTETTAAGRLAGPAWSGTQIWDTS